MSQFTTPLIVELIGENLWRLYEPFEYHVGTYPSTHIIKVPKGFITDFASVPRVFWSIIGSVDKHGKAAVIHDYLYGMNYMDDRKFCDDVFKEAMGVLKVDSWKIDVMYKAVRVFSNSVWENYKKGLSFEKDI